MKTCTKCKTQKEVSEFYKCKPSTDGLQSSCKVCQKKYQNSELGKAVHAKANSKYNRTEKARINKRKYKKTFRGKAKNNASTRKRQILKLCATPPWLNKNHFLEMEMFYQRAVYLTEVTGIRWHVDHIIPIQGENMSGLHVPWNLRVVPHNENESKGNRING